MRAHIYSAISYCLSVRTAFTATARPSCYLIRFDSLDLSSGPRARRKHRRFVGTEVLLLLRVLTDSLPERETLLTFPRCTRQTHITLRCAAKILVSCLSFLFLISLSHLLHATSSSACLFPTSACLYSVKLIDHSFKLLSCASLTRPSRDTSIAFVSINSACHIKIFEMHFAAHLLSCKWIMISRALFFTFRWDICFFMYLLCSFLCHANCIFSRVIESKSCKLSSYFRLIFLWFSSFYSRFLILPEKTTRIAMRD